MAVFDVFFFKQKTAYEMRISDWSSDVCSSDLLTPIVTEALSAGLLDSGSNVGPGRYIDLLRWLLVNDPSLHHRLANDGLDVDALRRAQIGRASCRERVCQYV